MKLLIGYIKRREVIMQRAPFIANQARLRELGFMIIASLYGSEELMKLTPPGGEYEGFTELAAIGDQMFEDNMVALAAMARANDDDHIGLKLHSDKHPNGVGVLVLNDKEEPLSAREACNKIIHAKEAKVVWSETKKHPLYESIYENKYGGEYKQKYKLPTLILNGDKNDKEWTAKIDLVLWVFAIAFFA